MTHIRFYRDKKKEWRWSVTASNGKKLADSGEGYKRFGSCWKTARKLLLITAGWKVSIAKPSGA